MLSENLTFGEWPTLRKPLYLQYGFDVFCFRPGRVPEAISVPLLAQFRAILEPFGHLWAHFGHPEPSRGRQIRAPMAPKWTIQDSLKLYQLPYWGRPFFSINEAGKEKGILPSQISSVCKGKRKKTGGLRWEYA